MPEEVIAETHYGDLRGTMSIDEADGKDLLLRIAREVGMPRGYTPVGFRFSCLADASPVHQFFLTIYATDADLATTGTEPERPAKAHHRVPVFSFLRAISVKEVVALLAETKQLDLVAQSRAIEGATMVLQQDK